MKNSILLRLFFISIGLPLTCASSPSTSSSLIPESNTASLLVDTTNSAPAVQLKDQDILAQSIPEESQVYGRDEQTKKFEELIHENRYEDIAELGKEMSHEELLKCLYQGVTSLDQFKGLYKYLKQHGMLPTFLAHGDMLLVRKVIVEADLLETDGYSGRCGSIYDAIDLSLNEDRHDRVASLFEAAQERPKWKNNFDLFVEGFFQRYSSGRDIMSLMRSLTPHGEEFGKRRPTIFGIACRRLVEEVRWRLANRASQKLLIDLVGQPSLLTPVAFAEGFLGPNQATPHVANFIKYGYKEAIEEGLRWEWVGGGRKLWRVMVNTLPNQFSGEFPETDGARTAALENFKPTKQDREEEWAKKNAPILLAQLEQLMPGLFPKVLWNLIFEYEPITWIVV